MNCLESTLNVCDCGYGLIDSPWEIQSPVAYEVALMDSLAEPSLKVISSRPQRAAFLLSAWEPHETTELRKP